MPPCMQTGVRAARPDDAYSPSFMSRRQPSIDGCVKSHGWERCAARRGAAAACRAALVHPASLVRGHRPRTATMVFQAATWSSAILVFARLRRWGMPMRRRIATSPGSFEPARQELLAGPGFSSRSSKSTDPILWPQALRTQPAWRSNFEIVFCSSRVTVF